MRKSPIHLQGKAVGAPVPNEALTGDAVSRRAAYRAGSVRVVPDVATSCSLHDTAARPTATVLPFAARSRASDCLDARVGHALTAIAAHRTSGAGDLYDLISRPLYALALAITQDGPAAQEATVAAFAEIWLTSAGRPQGASTAWVMDVACRCARATPTNPPPAPAPGRRSRTDIGGQGLLRLVKTS